MFFGAPPPRADYSKIAPEGRVASRIAPTKRPGRRIASNLTELHARRGDSTVFIDERGQPINGQWTGAAPGGFTASRDDRSERVGRVLLTSYQSADKKAVRRHLLPIAACLLLAACTEVKDFGAYWDKGFVDPALEGTWKKIGLPGKKLNSTPGPDKLLFVKDGLSYAVQAINPIGRTLPDDVAAQRKNDNEGRITVRTLKIGKHLFVMAKGEEGTQDGTIERYEIQGHVLREYFLNNGAALDFLGTRHPTARNIGKNRGDGRYVVINTFDDEVFRILSEIADDSAYWDLQCQYRKAS